MSGISTPLELTAASMVAFHFSRACSGSVAPIADPASTITLAREPVRDSPRAETVSMVGVAAAFGSSEMSDQTSGSALESCCPVRAGTNRVGLGVFEVAVDALGQGGGSRDESQGVLSSEHLGPWALQRGSREG